MAYIESHSCVRFILGADDASVRAQGFKSHVRFEVPSDPGTCSSSIGNSQISPQTLYLGANCFHQSTIIHEILHTMGFAHEQSRYDRDDYIVLDPSKFCKYIF